ncbi:MAG: preprotein translocase subunit SecG [Bacteroidales bacterium]|nr:preprotein translocase subunit SecG [Bacteroidales bacterium]MBR4837275.1 preprotein translocase subunit SecG [Bacteroidales bacterium]
MYVTISVLILIVSFLMMLVVLVQNSKGGGLASNFSSHNQILGVRKTTDFLEKTTWTLAVLLVVFCLASSITISKGDNQGTSKSSLRNNTELPVTNTTELPTDVAE